MILSDAELLDLKKRLCLLEQRVSQMANSGPVAEVDAQAGRCRVDLGDGVLSPWLRYAQISGALKIHSAPSIGQQMVILSLSGDPRDGLVLPLGWSDANASPGDREDTHVITLGKLKIEVTGDGLTVHCPKIKITSDLDIEGPTAITGDVAIEGASLTHNDVNIGDDHIHTGVVPGPLTSGPPEV